MDQKRCPRCETSKPVGAFYRNVGRRDGLSSYCVDCHRVAGRASAVAKRSALLEALGGRCVRCGFADARALQVDHVNGGGSQERRSLWAASSKFRAHVLAHPANYQLLCANCNWIKRIEEAEHCGDRDFGRQVPTERVVAPHQRHKEGRWSVKFDQCVDCGTTDKPHASRGRCQRCANAAAYRERKGSVPVGV